MSRVQIHTRLLPKKAAPLASLDGVGSTALSRRHPVGATGPGDRAGRSLASNSLSTDRGSFLSLDVVEDDGITSEALFLLAPSSMHLKGWDQGTAVAVSARRGRRPFLSGDCGLGSPCLMRRPRVGSRSDKPVLAIVQPSWAFATRVSEFI